MCSRFDMQWMWRKGRNNINLLVAAVECENLLNLRRDWLYLAVFGKQKKKRKADWWWRGPSLYSSSDVVTSQFTPFVNTASPFWFYFILSVAVWTSQGLALTLLHSHPLHFTSYPMQIRSLFIINILFNCCFILIIVLMYNFIFKVVSEVFRWTLVPSTLFLLYDLLNRFSLCLPCEHVGMCWTVWQIHFRIEFQKWISLWAKKSI